MKRRQLLKAALLLAPSMSYGQGVDQQAEFRKLRRVGLVMRPYEVGVNVSGGWNIYFRAGENESIGKRIRTAMDHRLDDFVPRVKSELEATLKKNSFTVADVPFLADAPFYKVPYGAEEPFYLDCRTSLGFTRVAGGRLSPGAAIYFRLIARIGLEEVYWRVVSYGLAVFGGGDSWPSVQYGMPSEQFASLHEVISSPDDVATVFLPWAGPLGKAAGEVFSREV